MIAIDIDGVIADLTPEVIRRARNDGFKLNEYAVNNAPNFLWEDLSIDITKPWIYGLMDNQDFWANAEPNQDTVSWLKENYIKHQIVVITHRTLDQADVTWDWFASNEIPVDDIIYGRNKAQVCDSFSAPFFIEDHFETAYDVAKNSKTHCYLLHRSYNANTKADHPKLERINSVWEIKL